MLCHRNWVQSWFLSPNETERHMGFCLVLFCFVLFLTSVWGHCVKSPKAISGYSACLEELWAQFIVNVTVLTVALFL